MAPQESGCAGYCWFFLPFRYAAASIVSLRYAVALFVAPLRCATASTACAKAAHAGDPGACGSKELIFERLNGMSKLMP
jgi:hypothetical protein